MHKLVLKTLAGVAFAAATLGVSTPAAASIACSNNDITFNGTSHASACAGFYPGNVVNGAPANNATLTSALASLGFTYGGDNDGIEQFSGSSTVNFATLLFGQTIIAVHYGNGVGSPGRPNNSTQGDGDDTAFYLFNAGTIGLDTFTLAFNAASTVTLFQTGSPPPPPGVPEPATWAMMLMGFGAAGTALRRSRRKNSKLLQIA